MSLLNRISMAIWASKIENFIRTPPGSDKGFSADYIAQEGQTDFSASSTWSIVCEEVLDTQFPCVHFDRSYAELRRRGIADAELVEMRRFAWLTAGWLNYEMMLWDWCRLDEKDIYRAIEWQFADGWISGAERDRRVAFAKRYDKMT